MYPILATTYGNFYAFLFGIPALLVALIFGLIGVLIRGRSLSVAAGLGCIAISIWFVSSLGEARGDDRASTAWFALFSVVAGVVLVSVDRTVRAETPAKKTKKSRANKTPLPTPVERPPSNHDQVPGAADLKR